MAITSLARSTKIKIETNRHGRAFFHYSNSRARSTKTRIETFCRCELFYSANAKIKPQAIEIYIILACYCFKCYKDNENRK
ncbi:MAG: hypothetical protein EHM20_05565 [Alphaproteobacteria bacterium]|nr:MAG: hypothetical protein EHM20_05565 [Alphaproteobacteria bacterium]